jgi:hypothetical protein
MDTRNTKAPRSRIIIAIVVLAVGLSCAFLQESLMPAGPAEEPSMEEPSPPTEPPAPADTQPPAPSRDALNAEGPWLLVETPDGLWAANPDGSGLTQLTDIDYWQGNLGDAIQPMGRHIAYLAPVDSYKKMTLNLLSLPEGEVTATISLTTTETEAQVETTGSEALRAIGDMRSYAWSPDGTLLAFGGLMDGPSAEIYLYTFASGEVQRVSQDEAQNYGPAWSPDGEALLYFGADGFGTGAGFDTTGVWIANGDGTDVRMLLTPGEEIEIEELLGWMDNTTAVINTWNFKCGWGNMNLRLFDLLSAETTMLHEGCYHSAVVNNRRGEVIFASEEGLYLVTKEAREPVQVSTEPVNRIDPWRPANDLINVYFKDGSLATFGGYGDLDHQVSPVKISSGSLDVATYGLIWGWTSTGEDQPGAWITGPGMEIGQIYSGKARAPIWDLDNNLLFFARGEGEVYSLYRTTFEAFYEDLSEVASLEANFIQSVAWLGAR